MNISKQTLMQRLMNIIREECDEHIHANGRDDLLDLWKSMKEFTNNFIPILKDKKAYKKYKKGIDKNNLIQSFLHNTQYYYASTLADLYIDERDYLMDQFFESLKEANLNITLPINYEQQIQTIEEFRSYPFDYLLRRTMEAINNVKLDQPGSEHAQLFLIETHKADYEYLTKALDDIHNMNRDIEILQLLADATNQLIS